MKTQTFGFSQHPLFHVSYFLTPPDYFSSPPGSHYFADVEAARNYREHRENGDEQDSPSHSFPEDGKSD